MELLDGTGNNFPFFMSPMQILHLHLHIYVINITLCLEVEWMIKLIVSEGDTSPLVYFYFCNIWEQHCAWHTDTFKSALLFITISAELCWWMQQQKASLVLSAAYLFGSEVPTCPWNASIKHNHERTLRRWTNPEGLDWPLILFFFNFCSHLLAER